MVFHSLKKCKARLTALSHTFLDMKDHHHIGIRRRVSYIYYVLCKHVMANCSWENIDMQHGVVLNVDV